MPYAQSNQYLWVGSQSGLLKFDGNQFTYYNIKNDNNSNQINSIIVDRENNLWIGTHNGLFRYRDNSFVTYDQISGLHNSFIWQIFRDKLGDLWVCSENNGIYRETNNYFKRYDKKSGLSNLICKSGIQDAGGTGNADRPIGCRRPAIIDQHNEGTSVAHRGG